MWEVYGVPPWGAREVILGAMLGGGMIVIVGMALRLLAAPITVRGSPLLASLLLLVQDSLLLMGMWLFGLRPHRAGLRDLGLRPFSPRLGCLLAAGVLPASLTFNVFYQSLAYMLSGRMMQPPAILPIFGGGIGGLVAALIAASVIAPVAEEVFFRGFLLGGLQRRLGAPLALTLSAVVFGLVHLNLPALIPVTFLGLLLGGLYLATGSLWPGIIAHGANNALGLILAYLLSG
jgi:membrane protease YdiL (CAAX protease family)